MYIIAKFSQFSLINLWVVINKGIFNKSTNHILFVGFLTINTVLLAQTNTKFLKTANEHITNARFHLAIPIYKDILKFDANNIQANYGLGLCYLEVVDKQIAYIYLKKAHAADKSLPEIDLYLARGYQYADKFDEAMVLYKKELQETDQWKNVDKYKYLTKKIIECEVGKEFVANPINAKIQNIGPIVNSIYHDYAPVLSLDENKLVFTSRRLGSSNNSITEDGDYFEDIYISTKRNGNWTEPINLGKKVNTSTHDAAISISPDGNHIFIYRDANGGDIYITDYNSKEWSEAVPFDKKINTKYNESSISMSEDGNTIYFTSDKPGGYGGKDIYKSKKDSKGNWETPQNLGNTINTAYDDDAPFIHDEQTLYFSSRGHKNMGGYDIFRTENRDGNWTIPENLGSPINTTDDDIYFMVSPDNKRGYYSSVKESGLGESDIYIITMPQLSDLKKFDSQKVALYSMPQLYNRANEFTNLSTITTPYTIYRGKVMEDVTKIPLVAQVTIINIENGIVVYDQKSDADGNFEVALLSDNIYSVSFDNHAYLFYSDHIEIPYTKEYQLLMKDVYLQKIKIGAKMILKNIFFETNKSVLQPKSTIELDKLYMLLTENANLKLELSGHTDNQGTSDYNKKLSAGRAKSVTDYLIKKGIAVDRLKTAGYGKDRPVADNDTEAGRQLNRRTEFEIIGN